ncbi:helix-turn-helix domain-containing protein [Streptomyces mirabilis]|uniref:helix-turn-helix domain-containing protein n=1 Tax=Streptomyces mirabilis TaxID=68239 RepID=UPI0036B140E5
MATRPRIRPGSAQPSCCRVSVGLRARKSAQARLHVDTVPARAGRGRFATGGLPALADRKRSGRPASFTAVQVTEVKSPARQLPAERSTPLALRSCPELVREVVGRSIAGSISPDLYTTPALSTAPCWARAGT